MQDFEEALQLLIGNLSPLPPMPSSCMNEIRSFRHLLKSSSQTSFIVHNPPTQDTDVY